MPKRTRRGQTITLKAEEVKSVETGVDAPLPAMVANGVNGDLYDLMRRVSHGEAFREYADLHITLRQLDDEIRRARHGLDGDHDPETRHAKGLILAGLEGERLGVEKQINRLVDRHFPLGMVV
jgi:hypothetical protein